MQGSTVAPRPTAQYVGPDVDNYISGLAQTVDDELCLHDTDWRKRDICRAICGLAGLDQMLDRNPYTLSGGEQTILTLATALACGPETLLLDCTLEQLAPSTRVEAVQCLIQTRHAPDIVLADSRVDEYRDEVGTADQMTPVADPRPKPKLNGDSYMPYSVTPTTITLDDISFAYDINQPVLCNLSLTLEPGRIHMLTGPNGAGKTTLCRLLAGLAPPTTGRILVDSIECDMTRAPAAICALHFQNPDPQLFETSVDAELLISMASEPCETQNIRHAFGLESVASSHPMDLPFVLRKRLAIAATFAMQRPWLIFDEPSLGQDSATLDHLVAMLQRQADAGTGVIVVTHSRRLAAACIGARHFAFATPGAFRQ